MAAPTPVSALVHSSTLVTAGVFLLIRFYPILHLHPQFNQFIIVIATSTTFIAGLRANTECDFKKIVALSTLSQLGVIIFRLGLNMPILAYFHIITHALFKALLFICVGRFINYHNHTQDLR
jgi:NADH-ubiquinone oxidoreductase chain 5